MARALGSSPRVRGAALLPEARRLLPRIIPARAGSSRRSWQRCLSSGDHPRACGEQVTVYARCPFANGSSPRVRGAGVPVAGVPVAGEIIPARAGSRWPCSACRPLPADHPRACGEQRNGGTMDGLHSGSSPRVRGAGVCLTRCHADVRIIPARAGSRSCCRRSCGRRRDHPRACGEQRQSRKGRVQTHGSSPRVRGAAYPEVIRQFLFRIIPARAGSSAYPQVDGSLYEDHPRACGEQGATTSMSAARLGSSPRVRGAVSVGPRSRDGSGIIPARAGSSLLGAFPCPVGQDHPRACGEQKVREVLCVGWVRIIPARAGSSRSHRTGQLGGRDHPRACGEQTMALLVLPMKLGSSPRVRGADNLKAGACQLDGIIPARAGSRLSTRHSASRSPDHPRACGEQGLVFTDDYDLGGSSPRVRGAGICQGARDLRARIIPARAGSRPRYRPSRSWTPDHPRACGEQVWWKIVHGAGLGSSPRVRGAVAR